MTLPIENLFKYHSNPEVLLGYHDRYKFVPGLAMRAATAYYKPKDISIDELEDIIAKSPADSFRYARELYRNADVPYGESFRWKKGEPILLTDPHWCFQYIQELIKEPWPAAEDIISTSAWESCQYAIGILKAPFPKGEPAILKDPSVLRDYNRFLYQQDYPRIGDS